LLKEYGCVDCTSTSIFINLKQAFSTNSWRTRPCVSKEPAGHKPPLLLLTKGINTDQITKTAHIVYICKKKRCKFNTQRPILSIKNKAASKCCRRVKYSDPQFGQQSRQQCA
jgi:hypothetical protein